MAALTIVGTPAAFLIHHTFSLPNLQNEFHAIHSLRRVEKMYLEKEVHMSADSVLNRL